MAALCAAAFDPIDSQGGNPNLSDILGFVLDESMGLPRAGFTWCVDFNWYEESVDAQTGAPVFTVMTDTAPLQKMIEAQDRLFKANGIIKTSNNNTNNTTGMKAVDGIRQQFAKDQILFGGVIVIGALDHEDYQEMENGFGIAPIPLYEITETSEYTTAIHNLARGVVISCKISPARFEQCTAFLDFQSLNSDEIMDAYYKSMKYDLVDGEEYNIEMLEYLRDHIRNNRDQYIENMASNITVVPDTFDSQYKFANYFGSAVGTDVAEKVSNSASKRTVALSPLLLSSSHFRNKNYKLIFFS